MNANLNALRIALLQCLSSPDVSADEITEVIRETSRSEMDEGTKRTQKCRNILEKLRIPYQYTTSPDYLTFSTSESNDTISFSSSDFIYGAAQPVTMGYDGLFGGAGEDTITLG